MNGIRKALHNRKTYIIVGTYIGCILIEKVAGLDIPGFVVGDDWMMQVMAMLGLGTLRAGIASKAAV